jgi:hypothetical protein
MLLVWIDTFAFGRYAAAAVENLPMLFSETWDTPEQR